MLALGFDPDLHASAWALVETWDPYAVPRLVDFGIVRVDKHLKERTAAISMARAVADHISLRLCLTVEAVAIEGQKHRRARGTKAAQPTDLINLSLVSGAAVGHAQDCLDATGDLWVPMPHEWKGSVPKAIHQMRICRRMGWKGKKLKEYARPEDFGDNEPDELPGRVTDWKHLMDAIGLALWAADKRGS